MDPFIIKEYASLSLVILLVLKSTLSDISVTIKKMIDLKRLYVHLSHLPTCCLFPLLSFVRQCEYFGGIQIVSGIAGHCGFLKLGRFEIHVGQ